MSYAEARAEPLVTGSASLTPVPLPSALYNALRYSPNVPPNVIAPSGGTTVPAGTHGYFFGSPAVAYCTHTAGEGHSVVFVVTNALDSMSDIVPTLTLGLPDYDELTTGDADYTEVVTVEGVSTFYWRWDFPDDDVPPGVWSPNQVTRNEFSVHITIDDGEGAAPEFPLMEVCRDFWTGHVQAVSAPVCSNDEPAPSGPLQYLDDTYWIGDGNTTWDEVNQRWWLPDGLGQSFNFVTLFVSGKLGNENWQVGFRPTHVRVTLNSGPDPAFRLNNNSISLIDEDDITISDFGFLEDFTGTPDEIIETSELTWVNDDIASLSVSTFIYTTAPWITNIEFLFE